jgi:hypothetical protein
VHRSAALFAEDPSSQWVAERHSSFLAAVIFKQFLDEIEGFYVYQGFMLTGYPGILISTEVNLSYVAAVLKDARN